MRPNPKHASTDVEVVRQVIRENPWSILVSSNVGELVALRLPITRFLCKIKLSQDNDRISQRQVISALRAPGPYRHPELADDMQRLLEDDTREA